MKALKLILIGITIFLAYAIQAQDSVNQPVYTPPPWGPAGYTNVRYYYLPDVEAYYDLQAAQFVCNSDGEWLHKSRLPSQYKNYDLYEGYKVVMIEYHGSAPYKFFEEHKANYAKGYRGPEQKTIGENPGKGR